MCIKDHGHNSYHFQTKKIYVWVQEVLLWKCHTQVAKNYLIFNKKICTYCNPIEQ